MKKTLLLLFPLFVLLSFVSCEKGKEWDDKEDWGDKDEWEDKEDCFELVYPVTYIMPDESTVTGNDEKAVWTAIKAWYESNEETEEKPVLEYPVEVIYEGEGTKTVENEEEMVILKKDCEEGWEEKEECFGLIFPVTYTMPDGSEVTGEDEETVWLAIKAWYEANEETEEKPVLEYPVEVVFEDGETMTVENEEAMIALKEDCGEYWEDEDLELCEWDEATEASGEAFEKYIVEELVYSEDCGCYISGVEKFLENGQTRFLIYYKADDCIGYGYKVTCEDGDCKTEQTQKCKFLQDCEEE